MALDRSEAHRHTVMTYNCFVTMHIDTD